MYACTCSGGNIERFHTAWTSCTFQLTCGGTQLNEVFTNAGIKRMLESKDHWNSAMIFCLWHPLLLVLKE